MKLIRASIVLSFLVASFCVTQSTKFHSDEPTCSTPLGQPGNCVDLNQCSDVLDVLNGELTATRIEYLRSLQCGFEGSTPKVCCTKESEETTTLPTIDYRQGLRNEMSARIVTPPDVTNHPNLQLLNHKKCGSLSQWKIVNGNKTKVFDYPWMALIAYRNGSNVEFNCAGTVISERYVLTAAHCVTNLPPEVSVLGVRLGEHDISSELDCDVDVQGRPVDCAEPYQDIDIASIHSHPGFTKGLRDDIALIRLDEEADFRPRNVRPICLPIGPSNTIQQERVVVTGWGITENNFLSDQLLQAFIDLVPNEKCAKIYRTDARISYKQMCAGGINATNTCYGDSGGPLQTIGKYYNRPKFVQYGIISFGNKNCENGFPSVHTNLAFYLDWLLDTMEP